MPRALPAQRVSPSIAVVLSAGARVRSPRMVWCQSSKCLLGPAEGLVAQKTLSRRSSEAHPEAASRASLSAQSRARNRRNRSLETGRSRCLQTVRSRLTACCVKKRPSLDLVFALHLAAVDAREMRDERIHRRRSISRNNGARRSDECLKCLCLLQSISAQEEEWPAITCPKALAKREACGSRRDSVPPAGYSSSRPPRTERSLSIHSEAPDLATLG